ncbi:MAG TPA: ATP-dependent zinc metalloprotease FtsH [Acidimicrobiales bacterium]|nr:ATP-dependent zinc metalloprotease FtsH [Acidimicrobiales bacterium]
MPDSLPAPQNEPAGNLRPGPGARLLRFIAPTRSASTVFAWGLVLLLLLYTLALVSLRPTKSGPQWSLTSVVRAAQDKRVATAKFQDEDALITGTVADRAGAPAHPFWTSYPRDGAATNDLLKTLLSSGAKVTVDSQDTKALVKFVAQFLLPLIILADLFALLFSMSKAADGAVTDEFVTFGKLGDKRLRASSKARTTFADVAGSGEAITELAEVRDYLADPGAFQRMGARPPKGVLIVGPPGCGKTLLARAVAGEAKASFFSISGSEFVESLVGVGAARVRDLFRQAREAAPAILFIDELDAVGRQRGAGLGGGHDEREQTLNELLVQMDGFSPSDGVAVLAATNRLDILDPALLRPGRFDRHITVELPDLDDRLSILRLHAATKRLADPDVDLSEVARRTPGFTGADLASLLNEAALLAVREKAPAVAHHHLDEAVERVQGGPRRKAMIISPDEKRRIAYHEAGHAVVAAALGESAGLQKVSVVSRGRGIGHLAVLTEEKLVPTRRDMEAQVTITMAGIAAEELLFGEPSVGAEADLERATNTARDMAGRYGMSTRLGRVRVLHEHREVFLGRDYLSTREVSQPTLEHLDVEVRRILDEQERAALAILTANRAVLDSLAKSLTEQETIQGDDLGAALRGVRPARPASTVAVDTRRP